MRSDKDKDKCKTYAFFYLGLYLCQAWYTYTTGPNKIGGFRPENFVTYPLTHQHRDLISPSDVIKRGGSDHLNFLPPFPPLPPAFSIRFCKWRHLVDKFATTWGLKLQSIRLLNLQTWYVVPMAIIFLLWTVLKRLWNWNLNPFLRCCSGKN